MTRALIIILLSTLLHTAAAEATRPEQNSEGNDPSDGPVEKQEEPSGQGSPAWPLPFNPSQDVGADSQVAFPTDI